MAGIQSAPSSLPGTSVSRLCSGTIAWRRDTVAWSLFQRQSLLIDPARLRSSMPDSSAGKILNGGFLSCFRRSEQVELHGAGTGQRAEKFVTGGGTLA